MAGFRLSPSQLSMYRECPMKYKYKYVMGRIPVQDDQEALRFGSLWDDATGILWESGGDIAAVVKYLVDNAEKIDQLDSIKVAALLEFYDPPIGDYEFIGNQDRKVISIRPGIGVTTKTDTLLLEKQPTGRRKKKRKIIREAKTTSREIYGDSPYWQALSINIQLVAYWLAHGANGVLYDVVKRPTIKPSQADIIAAAEVKLEDGWNEGMTKKAQAEHLKTLKAGVTNDEHLAAYAIRLRQHIQDSPGNYFQCRPVFKTKADIERDHRNLMGQIEMCIHSRENDIFPMFEHSCVGNFGKCRYIDACIGRASIMDASLFEDVEWKKKPF